MGPNSGLKNTNSTGIGVDNLPEEMSDMKLRDDKVDDMPLSHPLINYNKCDNNLYIRLI